MKSTWKRQQPKKESRKRKEIKKIKQKSKRKDNQKKKKNQRKKRKKKKHYNIAWGLSHGLNYARVLFGPNLLWWFSLQFYPQFKRKTF